MEAISYVNIFETKGMEYLLVILFLLGFLLLVRNLAPREGEVGASAATKLPVVGADRPVTCVADFECPYRACATDAPGSGDEAHTKDIAV